MNAQHGWVLAMLAGVVVFLYRMADVLSKLQDWTVIWNPPTVAQMCVAVAAALVAVGAALKIDLKQLGARE